MHTQKNNKKTQSKGDDVVVCLPGARIEHVTEMTENVLGHGHGGSVLIHIGTINNDMEGTTRIVQKCSELLGKLKNIRVEHSIISRQ